MTVYLYRNTAFLCPLDYGSNDLSWNFKFPYPEEILDLVVRGAGSPEKLLADAKVAAEEDRNEALAKKYEAQVPTQAGGEIEKAPPSDSQVVGDSILTEADKAHR